MHLAIGFRLKLHALSCLLFFVERLKALRRHGTKLRLVSLLLPKAPVAVAFGYITGNPMSVYEPGSNEGATKFPANKEVDLHAT